jgi:hypothetical protein
MQQEIAPRSQLRTPLFIRTASWYILHINLKLKTSVVKPCHPTSATATANDPCPVSLKRGSRETILPVHAK